MFHTFVVMVFVARLSLVACELSIAEPVCVCVCTCVCVCAGDSPNDFVRSHEVKNSNSNSSVSKEQKLYR